MTIYEELVKRVDAGETFNIDFETRTMKVGKQILINNGEYNNKRELIHLNELILSEVNTESILRRIENLYKIYKFSLPSERSDSKRKKYFKALSIEEITDEELMIAEKRETAQAKLEGLILCAIIEGKFTWDDDMGSWFWQSKNDSDLVILKSWIENKNN